MSYHETDIIGNKFGMWTVLSYREKRKYVHYYNCRCDCGVEKPVHRGSLIYGKSLGCGCRSHELCLKRSTKHGHARMTTVGATKEYRSWSGLKRRCLDPNSTPYKYYGGRGITVCDRWRDSFVNFLEDMGECPPEHSIERKDVNGNYEPENCIWIPRKLQSKNTRFNRWIEHQGKRMILTDWAREFKVDCRTLHRLLKKRSFSYCYEYYTRGAIQQKIR